MKFIILKLIFIFQCINKIILTDDFGFDRSIETETIISPINKVNQKQILEINQSNKVLGCPTFNIFKPCECNEVSFDGNTYQTQISCRNIDIKNIQTAFLNAAHETSLHHFNTTYDILEIKESHLLNLCCEDILNGFKFRTIKITDSSLSEINENVFDSTSQFTKEFVLMDIVFVNNLDDGKQLFNLIKNFEYLEGIYIISSNLREIPQDSFLSKKKDFGKSLQVFRVCNSLISKLYDFTFSNLNQLLWIDLGDNKIDQVKANTFTLNESNNEITLKISLSGNKLTSDSIEEGAFSNIKHSSEIYLNDNKINVLKESVWSRLINSEKSIVLYLKNNPLICDCRHHWIKSQSFEIESHIKDANCETGESIFKKNFALCQKAPLLDPYGDIYKKCCRQIQYKKKTIDAPETVIIHKNKADHETERLIENKYTKTNIDNAKSNLKQEIVNYNLNTDINRNQRLVSLPQKIFLSPAVLVKKPLKYRRLVTTSQIRHPTHHVVYAESNVPHSNYINHHLN